VVLIVQASCFEHVQALVAKFMLFSRLFTLFFLVLLLLGIYGFDKLFWVDVLAINFF